MPGPYIKWLEEEEDGPQGPRRVRAAWLVRDLLDELGERQELLAYLGTRPRVTPVLQEEVAALYPEVEVDWPAVERLLSAEPGRRNVAAMSYDAAYERRVPVHTFFATRTIVVGAEWQVR